MNTGLVDAFDRAGVGGAPLRSASPHELLGCVLIVEEYGDRAFDVPIPFVFVSERTKRKAIRVLREAYAREGGGGEE